MAGKPDRQPDRSSKPGQPKRIETQIHRRRKAKALSPLKTEWDEADGAPPAHLRMPSKP